MAKTVSEYYYLNYSKCEIDDSFFASSDSLFYSYRVIQCIASPIQLFTFYMILKRTPGKMSAAKFPLLVLHFFCTFQDFQFFTLTTPYMFFPSMGFLGVGFLSYIGVSMVWQNMIMYFSAYSTGFSIVHLFESRSSSISSNIFKIKKTRTRIIYYIFLWSIPMLLTFSIFSRPPSNQEEAKLEALKYMPFD